MTSAGSSTIAYAVEQSYLGGVGGAPTYRLPGRDIRVQDLSIDNALEPLRDPGDILPSEQLAQNFEGALELSWVLSGNQFHELVFNDDTDSSGLNDSYTDGVFPSAEWYMGLDYVGGTAERVARGVIPTSWSVEYSQGSEVEVSFTAVYGDEELSTSLTQGSITRETDAVPGHGADLTIDSVGQTKLQSATLSVDSVARLQRGPSRAPIAAVAGAAEVSLDTSAIFSGPDQLESAYGSAGATSPQALVGGVGGTLTFARDGTQVAQYNLSGLTPNDYAWDDLVNPDEDVTESVTFNATGLEADA